MRSPPNRSRDPRVSDHMADPLTDTAVTAGEFDYVILGGGTAGCVLAARLSEDPSVSVLLI